MDMHDTGWKDTGYDGNGGAGWAGRATVCASFDPTGSGRARREYGRYIFGKYDGYGFGYGTYESSGEENNTGRGRGI